MNAFTSADTLQKQLPERLLSSSDFESRAEMHEFLDANFPLNEGSHRDVRQYLIYYQNLLAILHSGRCVGLTFAGQFADYEGHKESPSSITLNNGHTQIELEL